MSTTGIGTGGGLRDRFYAVVWSGIMAQGAALDEDGRAFLDELIESAIRELRDEGRLEDESVLRKVDGRLRRVVLFAIADRPVRYQSHTGDFRADVVSEHLLANVLKRLCPGFWPFC